MKNYTFLSRYWLLRHYKNIRNNAGPRYTPALNIELPLQEVFESMGRTPQFYHQVRQHCGKLIRSYGKIKSAKVDSTIDLMFKAPLNHLEQLALLLPAIKYYTPHKIPWEDIAQHSKEALELTWPVVEKMRELHEKSRANSSDSSQSGATSRSPYEFAIAYLLNIQKELNFFLEYSTSDSAKLSNVPLCLLNGWAGSGKTHLLCDIAENRMRKEYPTVILFGHLLDSPDHLWHQVASQFNLERNISPNQLLKKLNDKAKTKKVRAFIIVDAINESYPNLWRKNIDNLIRRLKKFPNIGLIVSIRTGFEKDILNRNQFHKFIQLEHQGFQFREWEAVTKYFNAFNIPLPEIPLLMPEFQNPLFLLLFCKGISKRLKPNKKRGASVSSKDTFTGHEGATYIFEQFVKNAADGIAKKFNLPPGRNHRGKYVVWDTIIERVAEEMVKRRFQKDRISPKKLEGIVESEYPNLDKKTFIKELERNFLIVKYPKYSSNGKKHGYEFSFPFQKFSDHLIVRFLLNKYLGTETETALFSKTGKIGKLLRYPGLVEALSINIPERLGGKELINVAPWLQDERYAKTAFIESLIWRNTRSFYLDKYGNAMNVLQYINQKIINDSSLYPELLNAFITVSPNPVHPLNALFLHRHLLKFDMPKRDEWWSTFLHHQYNTRSSVDRIIEWAWTQKDVTHFSDQSIRLISVTLSWFLTTPNRFVRDKATKALINLLTPNLEHVLFLLKKFQGVNDLYITERLYAVAYGCVLRNRSATNPIRNLANWIYKEIFKSGRPIPHILLRDYARGVIETALFYKIKLKVNTKKIVPPYKSSWPTNVPSEEQLKKKYYPSDKHKNIAADPGYLSIWHSVMGFDDFARYIIGTNSNFFPFSSRMLNSTKKLTSKEQFDNFISKLSPAQKKLWDQAHPPIHKFVNLNTLLGRDDDPKGRENTKIKKIQRLAAMAEKYFKKSLTKAQKSTYKSIILPYFNKGSRFGRDEELRFDLKFVQRWILNRTINLGWSPKLHGNFDRIVNYGDAGRSSHKAERIGKKYQWLAYHELLARVSDNFEYGGEWGEGKSQYQGPWQLSTRDIDPSHVIKGKVNEEVDNKISIWQSKVSRRKWHLNFNHKTWLKNTSDLPSISSIINLSDNYKKNWVVLNGFFDWLQEAPPEIEKFEKPTRQLWYIVNSYLVKKKDLKKVLLWAKQTSFIGRWMPEGGEMYKVFLREYPCSPAAKFFDIPYYHRGGWINKGRLQKLPVPFLTTCDTYISESSSYDCSMSESTNFYLPIAWLFNKMRLTHSTVDGQYTDYSKNVIFSDSYSMGSNHQHLFLGNKDKLYSFLTKNGYTIFWVILGEKNLIGGHFSADNWIGRLEIDGFGYLNKKRELVGEVRKNFTQK